MINYEELKNKYKFDKIRRLQIKAFDEEKDCPVAGAIVSCDPLECEQLLLEAKNEIGTLAISEIGPQEYYESIKKLLEKCPDNIRIAHNLMSSCSKEEFLNGEAIIQSIIDGINPEWDKKHIAAYVHFQIGKILSYYPDFNFVQNNLNSNITKDTRNIWKSLSSGLSVCNGITAVERNILERLGIKTKELSSGSHSFLLAEVEGGNIIVDGTWDLKAGLFEGRPQFFGRTYEQLRKIDFISTAHKLDEEPENVIEISEAELREIFYDLGITKEDKTFKLPIFGRVDDILAQNIPNPLDRVDKFLNIFAQEFSTQATHLSESRTMLEGCFLDLGFKPDSIKTKFVYAKNDKDCEQPFLAIHLNTDDGRQQIRLFDPTQIQFTTQDIRDFDANYMVHENDSCIPFWKQYVRETDLITNQQKDDTIQL